MLGAGLKGQQMANCPNEDKDPANNGRCCDYCAAGQSTSFFLFSLDDKLLYRTVQTTTQYLLCFCSVLFSIPHILDLHDSLTSSVYLCFLNSYQASIWKLTVITQKRPSVPNVDVDYTQPQKITWLNVRSAGTAIPVSHTLYSTVYARTHSFSILQTQTHFLPLLTPAAFFIEFRYMFCSCVFMWTASQIHFFNIVLFSILNQLNLTNLPVGSILT